MKTRFLGLFMALTMLLFYPSPIDAQPPDQAKTEVAAQVPGQVSIDQVIDTIDGQPFTWLDLFNQTIQAATGNDQVEIIIPDKPDLLDQFSLVKFWGFILGLISPFVSIIVTRFFPGVNKKDLIRKSTAAAVTLIVAMVAYQGEWNWLGLLNSVGAFVMHVVSYDKVYNPFGLQSRKAPGYES